MCQGEPRVCGAPKAQNLPTRKLRRGRGIEDKTKEIHVETGGMVSTVTAPSRKVVSFVELFEGGLVVVLGRSAKTDVGYD